MDMLMGTVPTCEPHLRTAPTGGIFQFVELSFRIVAYSYPASIYD